MDQILAASLLPWSVLSGRHRGLEGRGRQVTTAWEKSPKHTNARTAEAKSPTLTEPHVSGVVEFWKPDTGFVVLYRVTEDTPWPRASSTGS